MLWTERRAWGAGPGERQLKGGGSEETRLDVRRAACRRRAMESCTCDEAKTEKVLKQRIECSDVGRSSGRLS
jgi:hypothetical protein